MRCVENRLRNSFRVARIGAKITVALFVRGEKRRLPPKIDYQIAFRFRAVARLAEAQRAAPCWRRRPEAVEHDIEPAEGAAGGAEPALMAIEPARAGGGEVRRVRRHAGDGQRVGQRLRRKKGDCAVAEDQAHPFRGDVHRLFWRRRHLREGQQRGGLGRLVGLVLRPSGAVADIDCQGGFDAQILRQRFEKGRLLPAGDDDISALDRLRGEVRLMPAKARMEPRTGQPCGCADRLWIRALRSITRA